MHRDKRLGLALGILLLGIVGAFFFRNEGPPESPPPELTDPKKLDEEIAENAVVPYLTGMESDKPSPAAAKSTARTNTDGGDDEPWDLPDFSRPPSGNSGAARSGGTVADGPPAPIDTQAMSQGGIPIPRENAAWEPVKTPAARSGRTGSQTASPRAPEGGVFHRVQEGDTLSDLAKRYLGSSARFAEIYAANRDTLKSPNDLRLGMSLRIPPRTDTSRKPERRAGRIEARPVSVQEVTPSVDPPKAVPAESERTSPVTAPLKRFVPVRRSPLMPGEVGEQTSRAIVPLDEIPRQLTQFSPLARRPADSSADPVVEPVGDASANR